MSLSSMAKDILHNPMKYLDLDHGQKSPVSPDHIWTVLHQHKHPNWEVDKELFTSALKTIRKYASQRGSQGGDKDLIHASILEYSKRVCHKFKSVNQLNSHLKGLYGCELPKKFREQMHTIMENGSTPSSEEPDSLPSDPINTDTKEVNIGGLVFTLTTGSSLTIGELSTESLNLQGMKSIKIDRVSEGRLFGVSLEV
jgi:hypothetical protein